MRSVGAAEASRHFHSLLREVSGGVRITITIRGKPVATIARADAVDQRKRVAAKRALLSRLRKSEVAEARDWSRADLYGRAAK